MNCGYRWIKWTAIKLITHKLLIVLGGWRSMATTVLHTVADTTSGMYCINYIQVIQLSKFTLVHYTKFTHNHHREDWIQTTSRTTTRVLGIVVLLGMCSGKAPMNIIINGHNRQYWAVLQIGDDKLNKYSLNRALRKRYLSKETKEDIIFLALLNLKHRWIPPAPPHHNYFLLH